MDQLSGVRPDILPCCEARNVSGQGYLNITVTARRSCVEIFVVLPKNDVRVGNV
jgi:hypothetical protein